MTSEERFNSITHLVGTAAAIAGLVVLVVLAARLGDPWRIVSFSIYGATLVMLYGFSTLYHCTSGKTKKVLQKFDHFSIYLLIAGTYTPLTLVTLRGGWGWSIFGVIWAMAVVGIVVDSMPRKRRIIPLIIYILMGWLILIALIPLLRVMPLAGFGWLLLGGLFYSGGVYFFNRGDSRPYFHGIWHLFVLAGSICHYVTVLVYVA